MLRRWQGLSLATSVAVATIASAQPTSTPAPIVWHISRHRIESSAIAALGYGMRRKIREIEFINGAVYRYLDVPASVYRNLMSAESKARFYDSKIRGHYRSIVVRQRVKTAIEVALEREQRCSR